MPDLRVAVIPGDGVGPEITESCLPVLAAVARRRGVALQTTALDWGGDRYLRDGAAMPPDGADQLRSFDAVLFGAVGRRDVPDHVLVWGLIIGLRQQLGLSVNLRPAVTFPGVPSPLVGSPAIDLLVVRENTEGEYVGAGGFAHAGSPQEVALEVALHSRHAITEAARVAFQEARRRRGLVTLVTKSNAMRYGYVLWDRVFEEVAADYPDVRTEHMLVDAMAARLVQHPEAVDVMLCSNLFGDILSDLTAGLVGGLGMAPSANVRPGNPPGVFEPVHGSAPDIAGMAIANPCGYLLSAAMMFEHSGQPEVGSDLRLALSAALAEPRHRTRDIGGPASTFDLANAVGEALSRVPREPS